MGKTLFFLPGFILWSILSVAQYVNTDSLVVVPGFSTPLSIAEFDSVASHFPDLLPGLQIPFLYGMNTCAGDLLVCFDLPSEGKVISKFGMRSGRMHTGTDIKMAKGDTIYASFDGMVTRASYYYGYGNMVVVHHGNNLETCYAHLSSFLVKRDDFVYRGEAIGLAGSTGRATTSHLHFEIRENDKPYNPELVFDFENSALCKNLKNANTLAELQNHSVKKRNSDHQSPSENYTVRQGDSLWKISRRFKTSVEAICMLNDLTEQTVLQVGQVLQLY